MDTKTCPACGLDKPLDQWTKNKSRYDGLASECRSCKNEAHAKYLTPAKRREKRWRERGIKLTHEQYEEMLKAQGGVCAVCSGVGHRELAVDHDHETGRVRGLLCSNCNRGLGHFKDNPTFLARAIDYLR